MASLLDSLTDSSGVHSATGLHQPYSPHLLAFRLISAKCQISDSPTLPLTKQDVYLRNFSKNASIKRKLKGDWGYDNNSFILGIIRITKENILALQRLGQSVGPSEIRRCFFC